MPKYVRFLVQPIHQSYFVVALAVGVVAGTILALVFRINYFASPLWLIAATTFLVVAYLKPHLVFVVIALLAGMLCSFFRVATELQGENYIREFYGQTITVTGTVAGDPNSDEAATKFKLASLKFGESGELATAGSLYVSTKPTDQIARSDQVTLSGKLTSGFGIYAGFLYQPTILKISRPDPGDWILNLRNWFASKITAVVPDPESSLGLSYLLGMKTGLPADLNANLRAVGLTHIVVASGAHLSILVEIARRLFGRLSRFSGVLFSILFILFFMAMVGFTPSIMRAGLMTSLTLIAWYVGRQFAPWRLILLVAAATLLINPMFVIDLGWLLSFASFAGIMILGPKITSFFYGAHPPKFIASLIITTIAATIMTLPITLYYFGAVSLISVIANLLILPTLPVAMGLTFTTGALASLPLVNTITSFLAIRLLDFHIAVVNFFAGMKSFLIQIDPSNPWVFLLYLAIVIPFSANLIRSRHFSPKMVK